jgi:hypothetical protein
MALAVVGPIRTAGLRECPLLQHGRPTRKFSGYRSPIPARQVSDESRDQSFIMACSRRLPDPSVSMMNTRKILMIIGGLLLGAAGTTYLILLQADRRAVAEVTAAMDASTRPPVVDSRVGDDVTEGRIGPAKPSGAITKSTAIAQEPVVPAPAPALAAAPAPMTAAPASSPAAAQGTGQPKPEAQPKQAPSTAVASVNVQDSGAPKVVPAQRALRGRDGLDRRATTTRGATPETDELVRESAKLDPSLPPPDMSAARAAMDQRSSKPGAGSNPVAAAMTDQLVRGSAKLDPSLPPPK